MGSRKMAVAMGSRSLLNGTRHDDDDDDDCGSGQTLWWLGVLLGLLGSIFINTGASVSSLDV